MGLLIYLLTYWLIFSGHFNRFNHVIVIRQTQR